MNKRKKEAIAKELSNCPDWRQIRREILKSAEKIAKQSKEKTSQKSDKK